MKNNETKKSPIESLFSFVVVFLRFIWDLLKTAIIVAVIAFIIRYFLLEPFIVQGSSMEPSLHNLDYLLIEKVTDDFKDNYPRGSIVVFHPPDQPRQNYIKRVIGLPGEKLFIKEDQIIVQNQQNPQGFILNENYLPEDATTEGTIEAQLSADQYYLLGDNRDNSKDSRSFGPVKENQIIGRAWLKVFSTTGPSMITSPVY